jgi:hypothetical protein
VILPPLVFPVTSIKSLVDPNNQHTIVANFQQDFMASMHNDEFQGLVDRGLIYRSVRLSNTFLTV